MGPGWQQQDEIHQQAKARVSLGLWSTSTEGSSKSPVSTRTAPAPPLWAELCGKARQSTSHRLAAGSCITPFHLHTLWLKHLQKSAAIQASLAGSHQQQVCPANEVEAFLALLHRPWKRIPPTRRAPEGISPLPASSLWPQRCWGHSPHA